VQATLGRRCGWLGLLIALSGLPLLAARPACAAGSPEEGPGVQFFESKVRPVLSRSCYRCHGPEAGEGENGLRVDSIDSLLKGGKSGPAIARGDPEHSLLVLAVRHEGFVAMPPKKKLAPQEIAALSAWIKMGAPWPGAGERRPANPEAGTPSQPTSGDKAPDFWAFRAPRDPALPKVGNPRWAQSAIDMFILAKLEQSGLQPAPVADKRTLIRRASFDLLGLPPSADDVDAFLRENDPLAFERALDRLLASPHYGERWGRHWLDLARYADSNGMDDNLAYPDAWRYRDWVIAGCNADKPFDQFATEQIAGDLLVESPGTSRDALLVATGFLAIGPKMLAEDDPVKQQMDIVDEQLDTTSRVFLALTMGCARCHDHKFDPITLSDYYGLAGIFKSTRTMISHRVDSKWNTTGLGSIQAALRLEDLQQIIDRHDNLLVNGNPAVMSADERAARAKLLDDAKREYASIPKAMAVSEGAAGDLEVFLRGNHLTRGPLVPRRFPLVLSGGNQPPIATKESGRLDLARWIASPENPLTARVIVNRIWRWHFGRGLVASVDNFGRLGELPSHPELLDYLARRFVDDGWSLKKLHRRITLSATYQMSGQWNERAAQVDPENRLLWRMSPRRVDVEELRDAILSASGQLDLKMGGTLLQTEPFQDLSAGGLSRRPSNYQSARRSVYLPVLRGALYDVFRTFDFPDPAVSSGDRPSTTAPSQALFLMNGELVGQASELIASRLSSDAHLSDDDRMARACRRILGRPASALDLFQWRSFLDHYEKAASAPAVDPARARRLAWQGLCRTLLSSSEFIYVY
jgi:cytochrome c553